jgi:hypothetical protein
VSANNTFLKETYHVKQETLKIIKPTLEICEINTLINILISYHYDDLAMAVVSAMSDWLHTDILITNKLI